MMNGEWHFFEQRSNGVQRTIWGGNLGNFGGGEIGVVLYTVRTYTGR